MTEKLTKNLLVKLIKEEINKVQLNENYAQRLGRQKLDLIDRYQKLKRSFERKKKNWPTDRAGDQEGYIENFENTGVGQRMSQELERIKSKAAEVDRALKNLKAPGGFLAPPPSLGDAEVAADLDNISARADAQAAAALKGLGAIPPQGPIDFESSPLAKPKFVPDDSKKTTKRTRRSGGTYFLRKYRKIIPKFINLFGGRGRTAFLNFYTQVGMPKGQRDYQFGRTHMNYFKRYLKRYNELDDQKASKELTADELEKQLRVSPEREKQSLDRIRKNAATAPTASRVPERLARRVAAGDRVSAGQVQAAGGRAAVLKAAIAYAKRFNMTPPTTVRT